MSTVNNPDTEPASDPGCDPGCGPDTGRDTGGEGNPGRDATATPGRGRCPAAHRDDRMSCDGPADAVLLVDAHGGRITGCVVHIAAMLAALHGAAVYPGSVSGAAIRAYELAQTAEPYGFLGRGRVVA